VTDTRLGRTIDARPYPLEIDLEATAVVVVDMQHGFGGVGGWWDAAGVNVAGIRAVVPAIRDVINAARGTGVPIVYLKMDLEGSETLEDPRLAHYYRAVQASRPPAALRLPDGVRQSDILAELLPDSLDVVVEKPTWSGFYQTELDTLLRAMGVSTLVFTGCTTSTCVDSTLRDAFFRDYTCLLLEDCCAEPIGYQYARTNHDATVYQVETITGWVADSRKFVAAVRTG
jgi:ureidoacrylate peracid hydrolase